MIYMNSGVIRQDIEEFQTAVVKLSGEVGKVSSLWTDNKYNELSSAISVIANMSKEIIVAGEKCCASIDKYQKIVEEQY